jgi:hypothetical protein
MFYNSGLDNEIAKTKEHQINNIKFGLENGPWFGLETLTHPRDFKSLHLETFENFAMRF